MDSIQLKQNISSFETQLEDILSKGSTELKHLYFNLGIMIEEQAEDIGLYSIYPRKDGVRINNGPGRQPLDITEQELVELLPDIKHKETLEILKECSLIYKSPFFDRIVAHYDKFIGIIFSENELRFEHNDLTQEFKNYKKQIQKEKLEKELSNEHQEKVKKNKI